MPQLKTSSTAPHRRARDKAMEFKDEEGYESGWFDWLMYWVTEWLGTLFLLAIPCTIILLILRVFGVI